MPHTQKPQNPKIVIVLVKNEGKCTFRKDAEYQVIKNLKGKKGKKENNSLSDGRKRTDGRTDGQKEVYCLRLLTVWPSL